MTTLPTVTDPAPARAAPRTVDFDGLRLDVEPAVITPRPWTAAQARWAAELSPRLPAGPFLELCAGSGPIGLAVARRTGRRAVLVDASAAACRCAVANADRNGLGHLVTVRGAPIADALGDDERFGLVLADPPYVPAAEVGRYPDDPRSAIDGGTDGLDGLRQVLTACHTHLAPGGAALVQVRGTLQAGRVEELAADLAPDLRPDGTRGFGPHRAVLCLRRPDGTG